MLEPVPNQQIAGDKQPITLLIENAWSTGQRPLNYRIDIATDAAFGNVVFSREGIEPGANGRTAFTLPNALGSGRQYYWRAQAQDGANSGPFASISAFALFTPVAVASVRFIASSSSRVSDRPATKRPSPVSLPAAIW